MEAAEHTRAQILTSALHLLHERGPCVPVSHVKLREAAAGAYLTTGAAYHVWKNQDDFHRDLAVAAIAWRTAGPLDDTLAAIQRAVESGAPLAEIVRLGAVANLHDTGRDRGYPTSLVVRASSDVHPRVRRTSVVRQRRAIATSAALVDAPCRRYRRRMRVPFGFTDLATALNALSEGFGVQLLSGLEHPEFDLTGLAEDVGARWTLFAVAADGVVDRFTEPAG